MSGELGDCGPWYPNSMTTDHFNWVQKNIPLSHSVDISWDHNGYIFQGIPMHEDEVRIIIQA